MAKLKKTPRGVTALAKGSVVAAATTALPGALGTATNTAIPTITAIQADTAHTTATTTEAVLPTASETNPMETTTATATGAVSRGGGGGAEDGNIGSGSTTAGGGGGGGGEETVEGRPSREIGIYQEFSIHSSILPLCVLHQSLNDPEDDIDRKLNIFPDILNGPVNMRDIQQTKLNCDGTKNIFKAYVKNRQPSENAMGGR